MLFSSYTALACGYRKGNDMSKIIAVTSGKGGTGKSTVCAGLGYTLAKQGHRTLLIELDFGLRCLDIMFGMENDIKYDLGDDLSGKKQTLEAVSQVPMATNHLQASRQSRYTIYAAPLRNILSISLSIPAQVSIPMFLI